MSITDNSRKTLEEIIKDYDVNQFTQFFRGKNRSFAPIREEFIQYEDENFNNSLKLGDVKFDDGGEMLICSFGVTQKLTERSGKKAQYEKAKKILRETQTDAGIFIFYDRDGSFRFSLIYFTYRGKDRKLSNFRRFTYFVSKELTNKTFLQRIGDGDFSTLEKIKEAFSVEKVTKDFYRDIANWYFLAIQKTKFPIDAESEDNGRNIAIIRLVTRIIFIWFMRQRKLIPSKLFDYQEIKKILKDLSPNRTTYYKAILQNLFFSTLNTKKRKYRFQVTGWKNKSYMDHSVYRYKDYFTDSEKAFKIFKEIPFLNGGLFDCLDRKEKRNGKNIEVRIDGFSDKDVELKFPNYLFFAEEIIADLSKELGPKYKKYKVHGLVNILSAYNFTIDENDPNDAEVALDPELLGKVFENLLASFNPETSSTARKATGSYYTPREIVNYMVTQSLSEYFKTHLPDIDNIDYNIEILFSTDKLENPFGVQETKLLVKLIDDLRIVDPAVGSGAFPMVILNKLVFILSKLDPENNIWKETQMSAVEKSITDPVLRNKLKEHIAYQFKEKNFDYGRKLYLIQKCIYGVDIQQIAVEIAKLRFFIALLVDEKIDKTKDNWDIEPLPNLDFKIMQGNSLISEFMGIDFDKDSDESNSGLFEDETDLLIKTFQDKKNDFQNEPDKKKKDKLRKEIDNLIVQIFESKLRKHKVDYFNKLKSIDEKYSKLPNEKKRNELIDKEKQGLYNKSGFNLEEVEKQLREFSGGNKTKPFFLWKLYFSEVFHNNGGFDVVIANPPYIRIHKQDKRYKEQIKRLYYSAFKDYDIYILFFEKSLDILRNNGVMTYITPDKYLIREYGIKIRKLLLNNKIIELFDVSRAKDIFNAATYPLISIFMKGPSDETITCKFARTIKNIYYDFKEIQIDHNNCKENNLIELIHPDNRKILDKIYQNSKYLSDILTKKQIFCGTPRAKDYHSWPKYITEEKGKKNSLRLLVCTHMMPYHIDNKKKVRTLGLHIKEPYFINKIGAVSESKWADFKFVPKILIRGNDTRVTSVLDEIGSVFIGVYGIKAEGKIKNNYKFLLALLNSKLYQWIFSIKNPSVKIAGDFFSINTPQLMRLPYKENSSQEKDIIVLADQILNITKDNDYLQNPQKQAKVKALEAEIDQLVYMLYGLTSEEIKIVERK